MRKLIGVMLCISLIWFGGVRMYKSIVFGIDCTGHLKRAADANTVELATTELETAIKFLEKERITEGYTSILYRTPDEDVGFWYSNLKSSLGELQQVTSSSTQLEKSNLLIKLRETLIDHSKEGVSVTAPDGISIFPNNSGYFFWGILSMILFVVGKAYFICGLGAD